MVLSHSDGEEPAEAAAGLLQQLKLESGIIAGRRRWEIIQVRDGEKQTRHGGTEATTFL